jgi:hypothetical protein
MVQLILICLAFFKHLRLAFWVYADVTIDQDYN